MLLDQLLVEGWLAVTAQVAMDDPPLSILPLRLRYLTLVQFLQPGHAGDGGEPPLLLRHPLPKWHAAHTQVAQGRQGGEVLDGPPLGQLRGAEREAVQCWELLLHLWDGLQRVANGHECVEVGECRAQSGDLSPLGQGVVVDVQPLESSVRERGVKVHLCVTILGEMEFLEACGRVRAGGEGEERGRREEGEREKPAV